MGRLARSLLRLLPDEEQQCALADMPERMRVELQALLAAPEGEETSADAHRADAGPRRAWFAMFESLTRLIRRVIENVSLVLIVDDAHQLDDSSSRLLLELLIELRAMDVPMVVTVREPSLHLRPLAQSLLDEYLQSDRARLLELAPLTTADVEELAVRRGVQTREGTIAQIRELSGGNPLLVCELLEIATSAAPKSLERYRLPAALVRRYLSGLQESTLHVVRTAALLGSEVALRDLVAATGYSSDEVLRAVTRATGSGVLTDSRAPLRQICFRHEVLRESILAGLSQPQMARIAEQAARNLESAWGEAAGRHAERLYWLYRVGYTPDSERRAVTCGLSAARVNLEALAGEQTLRITESLLEEHANALTSGEHTEALRLRGIAHYRLGHRYAALEDLYRAFGSYLHRGELETAATLLSEFSYVEVGDQRLFQMADQLSRLFRSDSVPGVIASCYRAYSMHLGLGRFQEGICEMEEAAAQAEECDEPAVAAVAHAALAQLLFRHRRRSDAARSIARAEALTMPGKYVSPRSSTPLNPQVYINYARAQMLLREGRPEGARALHQSSMEIARASADESLLGPALQMGARAALRAGNFQDAKEWALTGLRYNRHATGCYIPLISVSYHTGDTEEGDAHLLTLRHDVQSTRPGRGTSHATFASMVALRRLVTGDSSYCEDARRMARAILEVEQQHPHLATRAALALAELLHCEWMERGQPPEELLLAREGLRWQERYEVLPEHFGRYGKGLLLWCADDLTEAETELQAAVRAAETLSDTPARAWMLARLGELQVRIDPERARDTFHRAYEAAAALGMQPVRRRVERRLLLSPRELEVLGLVAEGKQAKEVAGALGIRVNTVNNHIQQVFQKTRTGNRIEAVRWGREQGLLGPW